MKPNANAKEKKVSIKSGGVAKSGASTSRKISSTSNPVRAKKIGEMVVQSRTMSDNVQCVASQKTNASAASSSRSNTKTLIYERQVVIRETIIHTKSSSSKVNKPVQAQNKSSSAKSSTKAPSSSGVNVNINIYPSSSNASLSRGRK